MTAKMLTILFNNREIVLDVVCDCPFCGKTIGFNTDEAVAMHTLPECHEYIGSDDSLAFIRKVNQKMGLASS